MSALYGSMTSDTRKKETTTRGHRMVKAHIRGWSIGVEIVAEVLEDGRVIIHGRKTGGSHGYSGDKPGTPLFEITEDELAKR